MRRGQMKSFLHIGFQPTRTNVLVQEFFGITENIVGTNFYTKMFSIFNEYLDLVTNINEHVASTIEDDALMDKYRSKQKTLQPILLKYDEPTNTLIEKFIDEKYIRGIKPRIKTIKDELKYAFNAVVEMNDLIKQAEKYEKDIRANNRNIRRLSADIKEQYKGLRTMGELRILKQECMDACKKRFLASQRLAPQSGRINLSKIFDYLWGLLKSEAGYMIKAANEAASLANTLNMDDLELSEARQKTYNEIATSHKKYTLRLYALTDNELVKLK